MRCRHSTRPGRPWLVLLVSLALAAAVLVGGGTAGARAPDATLLVTLTPGASPSAAEQLIRASGARLLEQLKPLSIYRVAVSVDDAGRVMAVLHEHTDLVRAAEAEGEQVSEVIPNDALYRAFQWN